MIKGQKVWQTPQKHIYAILQKMAQGIILCWCQTIAPLSESQTLTSHIFSMRGKEMTKLYAEEDIKKYGSIFFISAAWEGQRRPSCTLRRTSPNLPFSSPTTQSQKSRNTREKPITTNYNRFQPITTSHNKSKQVPDVCSCCLCGGGHHLPLGPL